MKKYLIPVVVVLTVLAVAWVFGQPEAAGRGAGARGMFGREEQLKAIQSIQEQLGKLKAAIEAPTARPPEGTSFQDMSEEERAKFREQFTKIFQERQKILTAIVTQLAALQGRVRPPAEGEQFIIINTADLKAVRELAVKEKAKETEERLTAMIERPTRGFGGGFRGPRGEGTGTPRSGGARERTRQP